MQELAKVLDPNELHIINVLANTQLKIWCEMKNDAFETDTGVSQGDCVSPNLYILSCKSTGKQQT